MEISSSYAFYFVPSHTKKKVGDSFILESLDSICTDSAGM